MAESSSNKSEHFKTDLKGPITSISAVANNTNGEWDRLVGSKVHAFTGSDVQNLLSHVAASLEINPPGKTLEIYNALKTGDTTTYSSELHIKVAQEIAKSMQATRPELYKGLLNNSSVMYPMDQRQNYVAVQFIEMENRLVHNSIAALNTANAKVLLLPPHFTSPNFTKEDRVAYLLGLSKSDLPAGSVPGTDDLWKAGSIVHELEHLTKQLPKDSLNNERLNEIDSDTARFNLIEPFDKNGEFREYFMQIRMIEGITTSVEMGPQKGSSHYSYDVLKEKLGLRDEKYPVAEGPEHMMSLAEKIRDEVGVPDGYANKVDIPHKHLAIAVQRLLDGTSNTHRQAAATAEQGHEVNTQILTPEERQVAQNFLTALDETGFTKMWEAQAKAQASASMDGVTVEQSLTNAPS